MKINGQKIDSPNISTVVIPREDGNDLIFKARAVLDYEDFDKLCPRPEPPVRLLPGGETQINVENPDYKAKVAIWATRRTHYMVLRSLEAMTLEWETVRMEDPDTWENYLAELKTSGFSPREIDLIVGAAITANGLDSEKIEKATKDFLATQARKP